MSAQIFPVVGSSLNIPNPLPVQDGADGTPGAAAPSLALQVAGTDGTNLQTVLTDTSGRIENVGAAANGVAVIGNPVLVAGSDGTDVRTIATDATGREVVVGPAASGSPVAGAPVLIAGQDGTDARTLLTDAAGQLKVLVEGGTGIPVTGTVTAEIVGNAGGVLDAVVGAPIPANAVLIGGSEAGNIEPLLLDASGFLKVNVAAGSSGNAAASATGSPVPVDADYLGASDGANLQGLLVESSANPNLRTALYAAGTEATIKAGSTASVDADTSIVVQLNPKQPALDTPLNVHDASPASQAVTNVGTFAVQEATLDGAISGGKVKVSAAAGDVIVEVSDGTNVIGTVTHPVQIAGPVTISSGTVAATIADGADVTLGAKADAKSTATDTTPVSVVSILKEISAMEQAPASRAVTNAGTFAVQATLANETTKVIGTVNQGTSPWVVSLTSTTVTGNVATTIADGADVTLGAKADAKSTATDTTPISAMSVLKQISASVQAPPSQAVTNAGTFATQSAITAASGSIASGAIASGAIASGAVASGAVASGALAANSISDGASVTFGAKADAKSTATDTTPITAMSVLKQISASVQAPPSQAVTNAGTFATQDAANGPVTPNTAAGKSELVGGVVATSAAAGTAAQQMAVQMDVAGCVRVNPAAQTGSFASKVNVASAGADATVTVPAGKKWIVRGLKVNLAASSQTATRQVRLVAFDAASNAIFFKVPPGTQILSTSVAYYLYSGLTDDAGGALANNSSHSYSFPAALVLGPGCTINTAVSSIQSSDVVTLIAMVEEYND